MNTITLPPSPVADEAEQAIVSALLSYPAQVAPTLVGTRLTPDQFALPDCKMLVETVLDRWGKREPLDLVSVASALSGRLEPARVFELSNFSPIPSAVEGWAETVKDCASRRRVLELCLAQLKRVATSTAPELLAGLSQDVAALSAPEDGKSGSLRDHLAELLANLQQPVSQNQVPTGWPELDKLSPVQRGDFVIIAAEAKGGKSTLALSYLAEVAKRGQAVLLCSLEMPALEVTQKLLARTSGVSLQRMQQRSFIGSDMDRMDWATRTMSEWRTEIRADCHDLGSILAAARLAKARHPDLAVVCVDYLQLVRAPKSRGDNREREVAEVSRSLRLLAMELDCVVLALSQLNDDGKLRESRAIGQDATAVWKLSQTEEQDRDVRELYIPAQRNGESHVSCRLGFRGDISWFGSCDRRA